MNYYTIVAYLQWARMANVAVALLPFPRLFKVHKPHSSLHLENPVSKTSWEESSPALAVV